MRSLFLSLCFLLTSNLLFAQDPKEATAVQYVNDMVSAGKHKFDVLYQDIPLDLKDIALRAKKAMQRDVDWYNKYKAANNNATPLPYHEKMGISKDEYDRLNNEMPRLKMKTRVTEGIVVKKENDTLSFKGEGNFSIFDAVSFDLKNKILVVDYQQIPYFKEVEQGEISPFGPWKGQRWKLETGNVDEAIKQGTDYYLLELTFGKVTADGKILMQFAAVSIENGITVINATVSGYLK